MHPVSGNDLKTVLLHRTAFLCVSRFLRLASFGTVNALMIVISVTFQPLFSVIPKIYSKGGKIRRLYIPKNLRTEATKWLKEKGLISGYIFLNRFGERITTRGIAQQLKHFAEKYGMNKEVVYPHSFRHRFAKNFLDRFNDLALLADLMGHESIETTRIYLRRTASEQQKIVDKVVNW